MSAKNPVSVLREVIPAVKKKAIDPRFDRNFGHFNADLFGKAYGFLAETQKQEIEMLRQSLGRETNPAKQASIKKTIERLISMKRSRGLREQKQQIIRNHRKSEAKLVEQGKSPYFLKKGDIRKLELAQEFEIFKKRTSGATDLERFIEKKRKRKASKQKKFLNNRFEQ